MNEQKIGKKVWIAILFVLTFLIYGRTINYEFVWDDERSHLTAHKDLMEGNVGKLITKTYDGMYIPVTYLTWNSVKTFAKDADGLNPKPFHFLNVLFHAVNVVLLFLILHLLFGNAIAAFVGAALFGFHPLQVESVAWISEFRGVYSCFFSFMALWILLKNLKTQAFTSSKELFTSKFFLGATALFVCALFAKPSAVMLPVIAMILTWCFFRESFKAVRNSTLIWIFIAVPVALSTAGAQTNDVMNYTTPVLQRIPLAAFSVGFYFVKTFVPLNLAPSYGFTPQVILEGTLPYIAFAVLFGVGIYLYIKRKRLAMLFAGYTIFIFSLLPVTGLVTFYFQRYSNVADRYTYFGMMGIALVFAYLFTLPAKKIVRPVVGAFVGICAILTFLQVPVWQNEFSIWNDSMEKYPDQFQAAYNRGVYYGKQNQPLLALADYDIALHYNPNDKNTIVNRANILAQLGRFEEALAGYDDALRVDPNDGSIYYNRALTNYNMGRFSDCPPDIIKAQEYGFVIDMAFATAVRDSMHAAKKADSIK